MARVKGIVSAGLASATDFTKEPGRRALAKDAAAMRADRQRRIDTAGLPPDWLPTTAAGAGAGFLFGPVGAIIGAGIAGILSKRRREGLAAFATQSAEATQEQLDRSRRVLSGALERAETDEERAQIELLQEQFEAEAAGANHPDPERRFSAITRALDIAGQLDPELEELEARRIEAEQRERDQFAAEVTRFNGIRDDLAAESGNYLTRRDAYKRMLSVEDTAWGDQVLLVSAFKVIDPTSAVLPGEAATAANAAGVPDFLLTAYNRVMRSGERLSPDQRSDLIRQTGLQFAQSREAQIERNTIALERARSQGIRDELLETLAFPIDRPSILPLPRDGAGAARSDAGRGPGAAPPGPEASGSAPEDGTVGPLERSLRALDSPDVRDLAVLPDAVQAEVDRLPRDARVFVDRKSGDLVISERGKPTRQLGLPRELRNSVLVTVPGSEQLRRMAPETGEEELFRRTPTQPIRRPVNR